MPRSDARIWLHAVWTTKYREPILHKSFRRALFSHIILNARKHGIHIVEMNGVEDHVHCLIKSKAVQQPSELMSYIKGESSRWINKNVTLYKTFRWQRGYGMYSVDYSDVERVRGYIRNQEFRHRSHHQGRV